MIYRLRAWLAFVLLMLAVPASAHDASYAHDHGNAIGVCAHGHAVYEGQSQCAEGHSIDRLQRYDRDRHATTFVDARYVIVGECAYGHAVHFGSHTCEHGHVQRYHTHWPGCSHPSYNYSYVEPFYTPPPPAVTIRSSIPTRQAPIDFELTLPIDWGVFFSSAHTHTPTCGHYVTNRGHPIGLQAVPSRYAHPRHE